MSAIGDWETVKAESVEGITTVTLNRPEKKNAMNPTLHEEMDLLMDELKDHALGGETDVLILTGAGDSFCAGQDLKESFLDFENKPSEYLERSGSSWSWAEKLRHFPRVTIAAVNGWCFGGGFRVCTMCDLAYAAESATFGLSEINFGILPAGATTNMSMRTLPPRDFRYLSFTGEPVDADEAERMRLVNETVPDEDLDEKVKSVAELIKGKNTLAIQFAKEVYLTEEEMIGMEPSDARDYEIAKNKFLEWLQNAENLRAIEAFEDGKFRPGLESYDKSDL